MRDTVQKVIDIFEVDEEYAGYCGINDLSRDNWEIAIEVLKKFHNKGVGYTALIFGLTERSWSTDRRGFTPPFFVFRGFYYHKNKTKQINKNVSL